MVNVFRRTLLALLLGAVAGPSAAGVLDRLEGIASPVKLGGQREFLSPEQAFRLSEKVNARGELELHWTIEPGYYLYRDKLAVVPLTPGAQLGALDLPAGETKDDPDFGRVEVYKYDLAVTAPVAQWPAGDRPLEAQVRYQGCAEDGICYPPIKKRVSFSFIDSAAAAPLAVTPANALSASDRIALDLSERSLALTLLTFLGFGLLLSLTPCVFPMIPILSGIIVGQKQPVTTRRALALSSIYVVAMALTYTVAGVVAGLAGQNLQAAFQQPAVIVAFAGVFVALALSMFGFYELQLPAALQTRLDAMSRNQRSGSVAGVATMGVLSAIIVGPCVAPPLAGALAYIGQTGSPVIGGLALFALGIGMGLPLIVIGASAGALLPRAGVWMDRVKSAFGVIFLGVAVWFLERVIPAPATLMLWATLLIGTAIFLGALRRDADDAPSHQRVGQAAGLVMLVYGVILIVGASAGANDPFAPLSPLAEGGRPAPTVARFTAIKTTRDLDRYIAEGRSSGRAVMLDFYADWCIECKHLERQTFAEPSVAPRLDEMILLRADVTANDAEDQALLKRYELFGPPAVLFFRAGVERRAERLVGFVDAESFGTLLDRVAATP